MFMIQIYTYTFYYCKTVGQLNYSHSLFSQRLLRGKHLGFSLLLLSNQKLHL